jgi:hypothetical protein
MLTAAIRSGDLGAVNWLANLDDHPELTTVQLQGLVLQAISMASGAQVRRESSILGSRAVRTLPRRNGSSRRTSRILSGNCWPCQLRAALGLKRSLPC